MTYQDILDKDYTLGRGYVYLLKYHDVLGRPVVNDKKVGYATDYTTRFESFEGAQASLCYEFIKVYEVDKPYGVEQFLHRERLKDRQIKFDRNGAPHKTEWFLDNQGEVKEIFTSTIEEMVELNPVEVPIFETVPPRQRMAKLEELGLTTLRVPFRFNKFMFDVELLDGKLYHRGVKCNDYSVEEAIEPVINYLERHYEQNLEGVGFTTISNYRNGVNFFFRANKVEAIMKGEPFSHPSSGANGLDKWQALVDGEWIQLDDEFSNFV